MAGADGEPVADLAVVPAAGGSACGSGLRIRLVGLPEEVLAGAEALARVFDWWRCRRRIGAGVPRGTCAPICRRG